jgi:hypothetical protein
MFDKDPIWFSQLLMSYQDKMYDTEAHLRLSLSTNTQDFQYFNPVALAISISTPTRTKVSSLNLQNAFDLYNTFSVVLKSQDSLFQGEPTQILKKYGKDYDLIFEFIIEPNNKRKVVRMIIRGNETDTVKIVVPFETIFLTLAMRIKYFQEHYESISASILSNFLLSNVLNEVRQIPGLIKGIPASITNIQGSVPISITTELLKESAMSEDKKQHLEESYQSLDNFLGGDNIENISIPDLQGEKQEKIESNIVAPPKSNGSFIDNYLKRDVQNLINFLNVSEMNKAPFLLIRNELSKNLGFEITPGMSPQIEKSIIYLSKYLASSIVKGNTENQSPIPSNLPIFQYNPGEVKAENFDLAVDLLVLNGVFREYRRRMESKLAGDAFVNGSITYTLFRCYLDVICFSFIKEKDCKGLVGMATSRFTNFDSSNIFKKLNSELDAYNLPKLDSKCVATIVEEMIQKNVFGKNYLDESHNRLSNASFCKLPYNNNLSLEQIINELLPVEVMMKIGKKVPKDFPMSDPVRELFEKPKGAPTKSVGKVPTETEIPKKEKVSENNLLRFVRNFRDQIPEKIKESFVTAIGSGTERVFEKLLEKFSFEEFGEDIVKGLYLWDPEKDPQQAKNYKYFYELYENELMTKDLILSKPKQPEQKQEKTLFEEIQIDI